MGNVSYLLYVQTYQFFIKQWFIIFFFLLFTFSAACLRLCFYVSEMYFCIHWQRVTNIQRIKCGSLVDYTVKTYIFIYIIFFSWHDSPEVGQGVIIVEASTSHLESQHSVGLLWTSDQPVAENSTLSWVTSMLPVRFETAIPASERPQNLRLRPRGCWYRHSMLLPNIISG